MKKLELNREVLKTLTDNVSQVGGQMDKIEREFTNPCGSILTCATAFKRWKCPLC